MDAIQIIVNSPVEELKEEFKKMKQGDLASFKNQFIILYETQKNLKDEILHKMDAKEITEKQADEVLPNMYIYMQKIEDVITVVNEVLNSRI